MPHALLREQRLVLLQAVRVQVPLEPLEERLRSFPGRVTRREIEDREGSRGISDGNPEVPAGHRVATGLRVPTPRVVGPDHTRQQDAPMHQVAKWLQQGGGLSHPVAECVLRHPNAAAGDDPFQTGQRQVIGGFTGHHVGQQPRSARSLGDGADRRRSRCHAPFLGRDIARFARLANVGLAGRLSHEKGNGIAVQLLDRVGADTRTRLFAARAELLLVGQIVDDFAAFEMCGQRRPTVLVAFLLRLVVGVAIRLASLLRAFRPRCVGTLQQLVELRLQLLDLRFRLLDLRFQLGNAGPQRANDLVAGRNVVGK